MMFNSRLKGKMSTSTQSLLQVVEPAKKHQAYSMKQRNKAHQVRGHNHALEKQHKGTSYGPVVPHLEK